MGVRFRLKMPLLLQQDVGPAYQDLDEKTVLQRIQSLKKRLTEKLLILWSATPCFLI